MGGDGGKWGKMGGNGGKWGEIEGNLGKIGGNGACTRVMYYPQPLVGVSSHTKDSLSADSDTKAKQRSHAFHNYNFHSRSCLRGCNTIEMKKHRSNMTVLMHPSLPLILYPFQLSEGPLNITAQFFLPHFPPFFYIGPNLPSPFPPIFPIWPRFPSPIFPHFPPFPPIFHNLPHFSSPIFPHFPQFPRFSCLAPFFLPHFPPFSPISPHFPPFFEFAMMYRMMYPIWVHLDPNRLSRLFCAPFSPKKTTFCTIFSRENPPFHLPFSCINPLFAHFSNPSPFLFPCTPPFFLALAQVFYNHDHVYCNPLARGLPVKTLFQCATSSSYSMRVPRCLMSN